MSLIHYLSFDCDLEKTTLQGNGPGTKFSSANFFQGWRSRTRSTSFDNDIPETYIELTDGPAFLVVEHDSVVSFPSHVRGDNNPYVRGKEILLDSAF